MQPFKKTITSRLYLILITALLFSACRNNKTAGDGYYFQDFDNLKMWERNPRVTDAVAHSGHYSAYTNSEYDFSQTFEMDYDYAKSLGYKGMIINAWCMKTVSEIKTGFVAAIGTPEQNSHYVSTDLGTALTEVNTWQKVTNKVEFPNTTLEKSTIKIYLFSPNREKSYVDDVEIEFTK
jgi:hypothetical protein